MATRGASPVNCVQDRAEARAISASCAASGSTTRPQSAKTSAASRPCRSASSTIRKKDETVETPSVGPMTWMAARTVSAVVWAAPASVPSASPIRTIRAASMSGLRTISRACSGGHALVAAQVVIGRGVGREVEGGEVDHRRTVQPPRGVAASPNSTTSASPASCAARRALDHARISALRQQDAARRLAGAGADGFDGRHGVTCGMDVWTAP